jgi:hypothetical protein
MFCITKWTKAITDSGRDEYTGRFTRMKERLADAAGRTVPVYSFRLLDDDGVIYAYGKSTENGSFAPLDRYEPVYGCTEIQYKNPATGKYETL